MEGRLIEEQLLNFRQEVDGKGISSYPHPKLMPQFWQFPTVSMGLGPLMAIYQARFLKYLHARGIADTSKRKVWVFCGDGEMDEPESLGAIGLAAREKLDNLIFVINCNLQRLDGPVRGNGKIIQELEADFRGAGWNVIKVIWGSYWDPHIQRDKDGLRLKRMEERVRHHANVVDPIPDHLSAAPVALAQGAQALDGREVVGFRGDLPSFRMRQTVPGGGRPRPRQLVARPRRRSGLLRRFPGSACPRESTR